MNDSKHFADCPPIQDDYDVLFRPSEDAGIQKREPRDWRLHTAEDGFDGISTAMTLKNAWAFAASLQAAGVTVLRFVSE